LTPEVIIQAQGLLNEGHSTSETAKRMGIKPDTLLKAIQSGRLLETKKNLKKAAQKVTAA
jgi:DNA-binding CsgD family transcriptional regulator